MRVSIQRAVIGECPHCIAVGRDPGLTGSSGSTAGTPGFDRLARDLPFAVARGSADKHLAPEVSLRSRVYRLVATQPTDPRSASVHGSIVWLRLNRRSPRRRPTWNCMGGLICTATTAS